MPAVAGKGGGKRKVWWEATCNVGRHGIKGYKSSSTHFFVKVPMPKHFKPSLHPGCPYCLVEATA